jgi:hypothetical protein
LTLNCHFNAFNYRIILYVYEKYFTTQSIYWPNNESGADAHPRLSKPAEYNLLVKTNHRFGLSKSIDEKMGPGHIE